MSGHEQKKMELRANFRVPVPEIEGLKDYMKGRETSVCHGSSPTIDC